MDDFGGLIYGLELQARALCPQNGTNEVRFFIATNSLKPQTNQIHLVEYEEKALKSKIFEHPLGEIWKLNSNLHDSRVLSSCYNSHKGVQTQTQAALLTMPSEDELLANDINKEFFSWKHVEILNTLSLGDKVKTVEFHPNQQNILACVVDNKVGIFNRTTAETRIVAETVNNTNAKYSSPFTTGKWSLHHQGNQFVTLQDCCIRSYDVRETRHCAWAIEEAHSQMIRDLDCNPNKQCHLVTGAEDGFVKVWDCRMTKEAVFARNDHAHWVFCVRYNVFHDQLILSSSSDCKVLLTCAGSVSSESGASSIGISDLDDENMRKVLPDGLLQTFDQHEDSVYCVEWSNVDPWIFASLSYDGRLLVSQVPKQFKYQIIL